MSERRVDTIDLPRRRPARRRVLLVLVLLGVLLFGTETALSYYVDALWFEALGFGDVFWKTLNFQGAILLVVGTVTFAVLFGAFRALKPAGFGERYSVLINGRRVTLPIGPVLSFAVAVASALIALLVAAGLSSGRATLAAGWFGRRAADPVVDPIFGRPLDFYLFTLPVWQLAAGWLMIMAVLTFGMGLLFFITSRGTTGLFQRTSREDSATRRLLLATSPLVAAIAAQIYLGRFERLFNDHTSFTGITYTDAHITVTGMLLVAVALALGAIAVVAAAFVAPRVRWLAAGLLPAVVLYLGAGGVGAYVERFVVRPNQLVREQPYITHNIEFTRQAFGLDQIARRAFPAETTVEAADAPNNQATLQNIRLWDWRVLQDTLRQLQEIRTYYDFPDIDIDRYEIDGATRQVMLATRELNVSKLPEGSRTWVNEKLVYTHGYGLTMNAVNGFTPEGLPTLLLKDMPIQSTTPSLTVTRPEVYFGEMTNTDVYVKTGQQEFNYPQGQTNSVTSYEGTGGILLGGFLRRFLIALDRGDVAKLPFSDAVTAESRLLMRRNVRDRVAAIAPFLELDPDPYIVLTDQGRLAWVMDAFTTSEHYPYSRAY